MTKRVPDLTVGLEEELFIVSSNSREMVQALPEGFLEQCQQRYPGQIVPEFLRSQVEIISKPHRNIDELASDYWGLRKYVNELAQNYQLAPLASSTHPTASWHLQQPNPGERYQRLAHALQEPAKRMLVSGMHLHVGIEDPALSFSIMNQMLWYLPIFLCLSTSSPFWHGHDTGFSSYRLSIIDGLPRAGMPEYFASIEDHQEYITRLQQAGIVEDARETWWDVRLSCRYPTVELRIADVCTNSDDAIAIAALYKALARFLMRGKNNNALDAALQHQLARENRWRARRYPLDELTLLSDETQKLVPAATVINDLLEMVLDDAKALGCDAELDGITTILRRGTSAQRQRELYLQCCARGDDNITALNTVIDDILAETRSVKKQVATEAIA